jgi:ferric-dicitrate binding protein FerR (iron transport regulator)
MRTERSPQDLLRALADETIPPEDPATLDRRRRRVVAATAMAIARASRERDKQRRWARLGVPLAGAAALVAILGGIWKSRVATRAGADDPVAMGQPLVGNLHRSHQGAPLPAAASHLSLGAGEDVATEPGGRGEVVLADGVDITLESETRLRLPDSSADPTAKTHEAVRLTSGTVAVRVPAMAGGHTFSVRTPDAEVTVHGTSFTVEVLPPAATGVAGPATRVRVTAGVVSVSAAGSETVLTAGMEWVSTVAPRTELPAPAPTAPAATTTSAGPTTPVPERRSAPSAGAAAPSATHGAAAPVSRLGEENRLLAAAIAASKAGDHAGAVSTLDDLLHRFPASALAQEAHVERFRALAHGGNTAAAAREARLYLALYPDGFAREEARSLAVGW